MLIDTSSAIRTVDGAVGGTLDADQVGLEGEGTDLSGFSFPDLGLTVGGLPGLEPGKGQMGGATWYMVAGRTATGRCGMGLPEVLQRPSSRSPGRSRVDRSRSAVLPPRTRRCRPIGPTPSRAAGWPRPIRASPSWTRTSLDRSSVRTGSSARGERRRRSGHPRGEDPDETMDEVDARFQAELDLCGRRRAPERPPARAAVTPAAPTSSEDSRSHTVRPRSPIMEHPR